jgi:hypothetical protein
LTSGAGPASGFAVITAGGGFETPVSWPLAIAGAAASAIAAAVRIVFMRIFLLRAFERQFDLPKD